MEKKSWKVLFSKKILERGYEYYLDGNVDNTVWYSDGNIDAEVYGSEIYDVHISADDDNSIYGLSCTCPYATDGKHCKHEAAVLYAIEAGDFLSKDAHNRNSSHRQSEINKLKTIPKPGQLTNKKGAIVNPFKVDKDHREYRYFDMESITEGFVIYEENLRQAQGIIDRGELEIESFECNYSQAMGLRIMQIAKVKLAAKSPLFGRVELSFSSTDLLHLYCYISRCMQSNSYAYSYEYRGMHQELCPHKLAALLLAQRYINENNPGDCTDFAAKRLIENLRIHRQSLPLDSNDVLSARIVKIIPQISFDSDTPRLFFKIGINKSYVLKNVQELITAVSNSGTMCLGKSETLDFLTDKFDEQSQQLYHFIEITASDLKSRSDSINSFRYYQPETIKDSISLYGNRLDDFFDIACKLDVELREEYRSASKGLCKFKNGTFDTVIEFNPIYDRYKNFVGIQAKGQLPDLIRGAAYFYLYQDNNLIRLSSECSEKIYQLNLISSYGNIDFSIGRNSLTDFYRNVLPRLKQIADVKIKNQEEIESYLPPLPEYEFFLDVQQHIPSCLAYVKYDDAQFNLIDHELYTVNSLVRDLSSEKEILDIVKSFFPGIDAINQCFAASADDDKLFEILSSGVNRLLDIGSVNITDKFKALQKVRKPSVSVGVRVESGLLDLSISADGISNDELLDILASYKLKKKYHRIKSGEFVSIDGTVEELALAMKALDISPKDFVSGNMKIPMYRALYLEKMSESSADIYLKRDQYFRSLMKDFKTVSDADFEVPKSLENVLRNYQQGGFKWLKTIDHYGFGGILADDMGLGKTLQIISLVLSAKEENDHVSAMVVCPASLVYNWQEEVNRFAPQLSCCAVTGSASERADKINQFPSFDIMVSSYDLLKKDIAEYSDKTFDYIILDEAQFIKNHNTAAAKSVKIIKAKHHFALTGTPIENRLSELWSIFDFLMPGFLYSYDSFKKNYELPISKNDNAASVQLSRMVAPFIMRRLKSDVLKDLPEKLEEVRYAKFDTEQQNVYDAQILKIRNIVDGSDDASFNTSKIAILAEITKARQICCDPSLLFDNYNGGSAKREACMDLIKSAIDAGHRILLFSQFTSMLDILENELKYNDIDFYKLTGSTSKEERIKLVKAYNDGATPVFLISLKAGGTGLNLTGADMVIHYDPWWNVAAQNQATDRAHRIGQTKTVSVYRLIAKDSIEEKILQIQERKRNLADSIISADINGLASMTREDLIELFS